MYRKLHLSTDSSPVPILRQIKVQKHCARCVNMMVIVVLN